MNETNASKRPGCGLGCLAALLGAFMGVFVLAAAALFALSRLGGDALDLAGCLPASAAGVAGGVDEHPRMREVWSMGKDGGRVKVARIALRGAIMPGDDPWSGDGEGSAATALRAIRRATQDPEVRAILLDLDTPGGGMTISDQIYHALQLFRASSGGRRIVALMGDTCASGGYYVALAADRIVAHPTTVTGSIGVLISSVNLKELAAKLGIRDVTVKSGENKSMLNPLHDLTPEQTAMLQQVVDELHKRFTGLVAESRRLPVETVREWADGRIFLAAAAREAGFVDEIGYEETALKQVAGLLETEDLRYIRYEDETSWLSLLRRPSLFGGRLGRQLSSQPLIQ